MAQAYEHFAEWFEYLNDDCDYERWSQYFIEGLRARGAGERGLELGCGSGAFCRALTRAGFRMSGADLSLSMLTKAEELARAEGLSIPFFRTDAACPQAPDRYDFVLAPNDVYNYVPPEKLPGAFRKVKKLLTEGGIFWLDVSSEYKLSQKVADNSFADDRDEVTYLSFARRKEDRIEWDVTLFVKRADGAFDRFDETHIQYIHKKSALLAALCQAGFEILSAEGHLGGPEEGSDRLNLVCRKK